MIAKSCPWLSLGSPHCCTQGNFLHQGNNGLSPGTARDRRSNPRRPVAGIPEQRGRTMPSDRIDRLARRRAERAMRSGDVGFFLHFLASALEESGAPDVTEEQRRNIVGFVAKELDKLAGQITSKG